MIDNKEMVTVKAYPARDGSKRAFAETVTRADGRTVITISEGGVDAAVGRAPRGDAITVDGVAQPIPAGARGGALAAANVAAILSRTQETKRSSGAMRRCSFFIPRRFTA